MNSDAQGAQGAVVVVAGASSASGIATVRALRAAGATAIAVGSSAARLEAAFGPRGGADDDAVPQRECDLTDFGAVQALASELDTAFGAVDGVAHLVGGWRGGHSLLDQSDEDWDFLARSAITTVRNTSRAFYGTLLASPRGRFAMVSSTLIEHPRAGYANYAAAKAAAEAWTRAVARGFASDQSEREGDPAPLTSAAVVLAVKALLDNGMLAAQPGRRFPGYTHVDALAARFVALFSENAAAVNGARLDLTS
ncbi:SDR family NAD(P)-dependent oxidoreductase [Sinomonas terrae]|uniref:SDR family NAD(P)-dependent oxidoreductase n=1 Tax=Sinomonas terrae TaxID=2908838 RepID=A0ABS9U1U8_9MICC|nr:SDR family NAD(P)-dependent oxidoreductase [Sinomonas terrae]MCH6470550.1 SDR family NAD(P)-dependent oxidoreductase [Sinomonas terrae]